MPGDGHHTSRTERRSLPPSWRRHGADRHPRSPQRPPETTRPTSLGPSFTTTGNRFLPYWERKPKTAHKTGVTPFRASDTSVQLFVHGLHGAESHHPDVSRAGPFFVVIERQRPMRSGRPRGRRRLHEAQAGAKTTKCSPKWPLNTSTLPPYRTINLPWVSRGTVRVRTTVITYTEAAERRRLHGSGFPDPQHQGGTVSSSGRNGREGDDDDS